MRHASSRRTVLSLVSPLVAVLAVVPARAHAKDASPPAAARKAEAPSAVDKRKATPRPPRDAADGLYGCRLQEDLACTVVHETAKGVVVVTFQPAGMRDGRTWSVVNVPTGGASTSGGTIYIVPEATQPTPERPPLRVSSNNALILD
jgi:hypothetical protein